MKHLEFQRVLAQGWVSSGSFGPTGDLRIFSAARSEPGDLRYAWFTSADWRRGRIQVDRRGAISDIAMEPYGGGKGKLRGHRVDVSVDFGRGSAAVTVEDEDSAIGKWTASELALEADEGAARVVDAGFAAALFLWCARPEAFRVEARPPFA